MHALVVRSSDQSGTGIKREEALMSRNATSTDTLQMLVRIKLYRAIVGVSNGETDQIKLSCQSAAYIL